MHAQWRHFTYDYNLWLHIGMVLALPSSVRFLFPVTEKVVTVKRHEGIAALFDLTREQWESVGIRLRNSRILSNCDDLRFLVHSRVQATVIIVLASCSGSKPLTFKTKRFGRCVIYMTPFFLLAEGTENDSSLKPIASNQWGQCIKSEKEHMKPPEWSGGKKDGEKSRLGFEPRQRNQLEK